MDKGVNAIRDQSKSIPSSGICNILPRSVVTIHCPAILSFPALLQLRQLLVIWGLSERVPVKQCALCSSVPSHMPLCSSASVPDYMAVCQQWPMSTAPATSTLPAVSCSVSEDLTYTCSMSHYFSDILHLQCVSPSQPEPRSRCHIHPPMHTYTLIPHIDSEDNLLITLVAFYQ